MKNQQKYVFMLLATTFFWGTTFVAQSLGADRLGAFTFLLGRSILGALFIRGVIFVRDRLSSRSGASRPPMGAAEKKQLIKASLICGTCLFFASAAQQIGIGGTTTAKAGFITAMYVVIVPFFSIFVGKCPSPKLWLCVVLCVAGLYRLSMTAGNFSLEQGDATVLLCAFLFSIQIMAVDHYAPTVDGVWLSCLQFCVVSVWSLLFTLLLEDPTPEAVLGAALPILYAGILSSGVAYTLQIIAQSKLDPSLASLLMSLESVFSALAGWVVLHQAMTGREISGALLMFIGIVLAQVDIPLPKKKTADPPSV